MLNTLNVAQSGLSVAQVQVENVMNNIANENTDGYKRRVVNVSEMDINDSRLTGRGSIIDDVTRVTNIYMYDNLIKEQSKDSQNKELSMMLSNVEAVFYETEDSGFSNDLDNYFQAIEDLRANPYNEIYRSNLVNTGNIVVDDLKSIYGKLENLESATNNFIDDNVSEINGILTDIGDVNKQISDAINPSNDLLDKRDNLESRLSKYVTIDVDRGDPYSLSINGVAAVRYDTNIHSLQVERNAITQSDVYTDTNNNSTLLIDKNNNAITFDGVDELTYTFDKDLSVTVTNGEVVNGITVDSSNLVQALTYKINNDPQLSNLIEAHNGKYSIDDNGNKLPQQPTTDEHFLIIESKVPGQVGEFESKITINTNPAADPAIPLIEALKNDYRSVEANDDVHISIFDKELTITGGSLKSMLNNVDTRSSSNQFTEYKDMLNDFAKALADMSEGYILNDNGTYVSGKNSSESSVGTMVEIGLFDGATVDTLKFNASIVNELSQENLDYLSTIHWNEEIDVDGSGSHNTSLSKYFQSLKVNVSGDKENADYKMQTQEAVTEALIFNYEKITKVNKDNELIELIKFQSAYEANAKLITIVDEMLATILGMRR